MNSYPYFCLTHEAVFSQVQQAKLKKKQNTTLQVYTLTLPILCNGEKEKTFPAQAV